MIGIWYVPKKNKFYSKYVRIAYFQSNYKVGYVNNYGHELVALFYITSRKIVQCNSITDYYNIKKPKLVIRNLVIDRLIGLLYKMKKKGV